MTSMTQVQRDVLQLRSSQVVMDIGRSLSVGDSVDDLVDCLIDIRTQQDDIERLINEEGAALPPEESDD